MRKSLKSLFGTLMSEGRKAKSKVFRPTTISMDIEDEFQTDQQLTKAKVHKIFAMLVDWREKNQAPVDSMGASSMIDKDTESNVDKNERAFQYMVGVLLSVQSQDPVTDRVMKSLLADGVSIDKYYKLTQTQIQEKIKGINFNNSKAKYIHLAAKRIVEDCEGKVPQSIEDIKKFPGIGNKVGNIILQQAFDIHTGIAVDVHVHRISNRLGWVDSKTPDQTMEQLHRYFDKEDYEKVNFNMVGLGQLLCKANNPKCLECPISDFCDFGKTEIKRQLRTAKRRTPSVSDKAGIMLKKMIEDETTRLFFEEENRENARNSVNDEQKTRPPSKKVENESKIKNESEKEPTKSIPRDAIKYGRTGKLKPL